MLPNLPKPLLLSLCNLAILGSFASAGTFGSDAHFLKKHTPLIVLSDASGQAKVALAPALQGRVMTSTGAGDTGPSYGWVNRDLFELGKLQPHVNVFGGEDRFWIGPEGGQFSVFFAPKAKFDLVHWQTPAPLDTEPFDVVSQSDRQATFLKKFTLTNYSGTSFQVQVKRRVRLLDADEIWDKLDMSTMPGVSAVGYETDNQLKNVGDKPWTHETGQLSIWILGQFNASPSTTVEVPYKQGDGAAMGKVVESGYFGTVPANRLSAHDGVIQFKADAHYRSKIGLNPHRAMGVLGSYNSDAKVLTLVYYNQPDDRTDYVNSQWKIQDNPFGGDVANAYNDGPNDLGKSLGNFYELESSSPAAALDPDDTIEHVRQTIHLSGSTEQLDRIAFKVLGVHLGK